MLAALWILRIRVSCVKLNLPYSAQSGKYTCAKVVANPVTLVTENHVDVSAEEPYNLVPYMDGPMAA